LLPDEEESCRPHFVSASTDLCALVALLLSSSDNAPNGTASKEEWVNHFQLAGNFRQPGFGCSDFRASPGFVPFIFLHHEHDAEGFGPVAKAASKLVVG